MDWLWMPGVGFLDIFQNIFQKRPVGVCESQRQWNLNQLETMTGVKIELFSSKYKTLNNKRFIVYYLD